MVQQSVSTTSSDEKRIVEEPSNSRLDRTASYRDLMLLAITSLGVIYGDMSVSLLSSASSLRNRVVLHFFTDLLISIFERY